MVIDQFNRQLNGNGSPFLLKPFKLSCGYW